MNEAETLKTIINLMQSFGVWIVFFWLYISEKKSHEATRNQYRNDLREVAGFNANTVSFRNRDISQIPGPTTPSAINDPISS